MRDQVIALHARYEPVVRDAVSVAGRNTWRALVATGRVLKRAALAALEGIEKVLLSPVGRERVHATATFTFIFLFAITSVDFLLSGGPEFSVPQRAAPAHRLVRVDAPVAVAQAPAAPSESVPTALSPSLAEATESNVIQVSQSFAPRRPAHARNVQTAAPQAATAALADSPAAEPAVVEAAPRKHQRVKGEDA